MSKLYDTYLFLKSNETSQNHTLYLFKSGIFFILLDEDAKIASNYLNLKVSYFAENVIKCGFPINSFEKYSALLKKSPYHFKIVEANKTSSNHTVDEKVKNLLTEICSIDTNYLSVKEAYEFIDKIQLQAKSISF